MPVSTLPPAPPLVLIFYLILLPQLLLLPSAMSTKVCALFGYGPGLGAAVARRWTAEGWHVALLGRSADKLQAAGISNATPYVCDVTQPEAIESTVAKITRELGECGL